MSAVADALEETSYFSRACDGDGGACLGRLCDLITTQLTQDRPRAVDDAALFLTHTRVTAPDDVASWALTESPTAASESRELVRRQLARWRLNDLEPTTEIVVSELVGNAIRHAKGPLRLRLLRSGSLICEVYDAASRPRASGGPRRWTRADGTASGVRALPALGHPVSGRRQVHLGRAGTDTGQRSPDLSRAARHGSVPLPYAPRSG